MRFGIFPNRRTRRFSPILCLFFQAQNSSKRVFLIGRYIPIEGRRPASV
jgi:hypothetical protein